MSSIAPAQMDVERNKWSMYFSQVIKNATESDCAAYAVLHQDKTIDFFAILEEDCYLGALDSSNTTPLFPDDTTLDSIRILQSNIIFWIIQVQDLP